MSDKEKQLCRCISVIVVVDTTAEILSGQGRQSRIIACVFTALMLHNIDNKSLHINEEFARHFCQALNINKYY